MPEEGWAGPLKPLAGWGFPMLARKAHFFRQGDIVSVCGKWMYSGPRDTQTTKSPDDCALCSKWVVKHG